MTCSLRDAASIGSLAEAGAPASARRSSAGPVALLALLAAVLPSLAFVPTSAAP